MLNGGYWGIPLQPNTSYQGSFYAKEDSADVGAVTASLVANQSGKVLASAVVSGVGTDWKQYKFTLKTGAIEPSMENHLVLTVAHPGSLWLNLVSLFPPTYHDRANGNRIDLMEKLAAMHPQFLRFPGRQLSRGRSPRRLVRLEEDDRSARGSARASESVGLLVDGRAWACSSFSSGAKTCTCSRCWPSMRATR